jgi:hypothetical protein
VKKTSHAPRTPTSEFFEFVDGDAFTSTALWRFQLWHLLR